MTMATHPEVDVLVLVMKALVLPIKPAEVFCPSAKLMLPPLPAVEVACRVDPKVTDPLVKDETYCDALSLAAVVTATSWAVPVILVIDEMLQLLAAVVCVPPAGVASNGVSRSTPRKTYVAPTMWSGLLDRVTDTLPLSPPKA
jgi:hypothetical protein